MSDDGDDTDKMRMTFFAVGLDNDQDGIPDLLDIDDDNDGVLDSFEKCIDFQLDGLTFDNLTLEEDSKFSVALIQNSLYQMLYLPQLMVGVEFGI